jgi:hypothetical protein
MSVASVCGLIGFSVRVCRVQCAFVGRLHKASIVERGGSRQPAQW